MCSPGIVAVRQRACKKLSSHVQYILAKPVVTLLTLNQSPKNTTVQCSPKELNGME